MITHLNLSLAKTLSSSVSRTARSPPSCWQIILLFTQSVRVAFATQKHLPVALWHSFADIKTKYWKKHSKTYNFPRGHVQNSICFTLTEVKSKESTCKSYNRITPFRKVSNIFLQVTVSVLSDIRFNASIYENFFNFLRNAVIIEVDLLEIQVT